MREKNRKNKRIKEKTRRDREVHRARARHGAIEDEKEKKTKMDWVFSLFSVTDVPLLFRSAKCLSYYTPILSLSLFFSSLWHLILLYPWLQNSVVLWLLLHNYHVHQYTASSIAYQLKWPAVYQKASLFLSRVSNWQSGVAERVCTLSTWNAHSRYKYKRQHQQQQQLWWMESALSECAGWVSYFCSFVLVS